MSVLFLHLKNIGDSLIESHPEEDFGFDYDINDSYKILGDYSRGDAGLVKIHSLIKNLHDLKDKGANYVSVDWNCDHNEIELYGTRFRLANEEEIKSYKSEKLNAQKLAKKVEVERLEKRLEELKNKL